MIATKPWPIQKENYASEVIVPIRPIFGYRLAELGNFQNMMRFIRQIDFNRRQERLLEAIDVKNRLWPLTDSSPFVIIRRRQVRSRHVIFPV